MEPDEIAAYFTRTDGSYLFARWGRPIAPVVFGVDDATLSVVKGALTACCDLARHPLAEIDPDLVANLFVFFITDWDEIRAIPDADRLLPDLHVLLARLKDAQATQYRAFRFDPEGAIRAAFVFIRMDEDLATIPAETIALGQSVQTMLLWSDLAFQDRSPLATAEGRTLLRPQIAALLAAAYDPVLPAMARDPSHALRLAARLR